MDFKEILMVAGIVFAVNFISSRLLKGQVAELQGLRAQTNGGLPK